MDTTQSLRTKTQQTKNKVYIARCACFVVFVGCKFAVVASYVTGRFCSGCSVLYHSLQIGTYDTASPAQSFVFWLWRGTTDWVLRSTPSTSLIRTINCSRRVVEASAWLPVLVNV